MGIFAVVSFERGKYVLNTKTVLFFSTMNADQLSVIPQFFLCNISYSKK